MLVFVTLKSSMQKWQINLKLNIFEAQESLIQEVILPFIYLGFSVAFNTVQVVS